MNKELLQSAKDEAAREYGYEWYNDALYSFLEVNEGSYNIHKITNRAMEIYAERVNEVYDIDFNGHVLARIQVSANGLVVTNAMNGYGDGISIDKITIKTA